MNGIVGSGFIGPGVRTALSKIDLFYTAGAKQPYRPTITTSNQPIYYGIFTLIVALDGADDNFHDTFVNASRAGITMNDHQDPITCTDDTHQITIHLPCRLAERANRYASENGSTITNVVIEALDRFLSSQK